MDDSRLFRKSVMFLIGATRGGPMRAKIMHELLAKPQNPNLLAQILNVDYKTIRHHLEVLQKSNWVLASAEKYGQSYKATFTEGQKQIFKDIWREIGKKL